MKKGTIILRASAMLAVISAMVVGVTYAALQSTATLTNNNITSATATLLVDGSDANNDFTASEAGFTFSNLVPGAGYSTPPESFSLKNDGTAPLAVTVYASAGTLSGTIDKSKVHVKFTNADTTDTAEYTLAQLEALFNNVPGASGVDNLAAGASANFQIQVRLDADAITGGSASVSNFNFVFTGTAVVLP